MHPSPLPTVPAPTSPTTASCGPYVDPSASSNGLHGSPTDALRPSFNGSNQYAFAYDDGPSSTGARSPCYGRNDTAPSDHRQGPIVHGQVALFHKHGRQRCVDPTALLPEEILLLIAREVGHARLKTRRQDLLALATTCRRFRKCATRALWEHLEVAITPVPFKYDPAVPIPSGPTDLHFFVMPRGRPFAPSEAALCLKPAWLRSLTLHDPHSRAELQAVRAGNSLVKFFKALGVPPYLRRIELRMELNYDLRCVFEAAPSQDAAVTTLGPTHGALRMGSPSVPLPSTIAHHLSALTCQSPTFLLLANGPHHPRLEFPHLRFLTVLAPNRATSGAFGEVHVTQHGLQGTLQDLPNMPKLVSLVLSADVDVSERVLHHLLFLAASRLVHLAVYPTELAANSHWLRTSTLPSSLPRIRVLHTNQVFWNLVIGHIRAPRLTHLAITSAQTPLTDPQLHRVGHLASAPMVQSYLSHLTALRLRGNGAELFLNKDQVLALATLPHLAVFDASLELLGPEPVHIPLDTPHVPFPSLIQLGSNAPLAAWVGAWPFPKLHHLRISGMSSRVMCAATTIHIPVLGWPGWRRLEISPEDGTRVVVDQLRFTAHMEVILINASGVWLPPSLTVGPMTRLALPAVTLVAMRDIHVHPPESAMRNLTISGGPPWGVAQVLAPHKVRAREVHVFWSNIPDLPALEWLSRMPGLQAVQLNGERSNLAFAKSGPTGGGEGVSSAVLASLRNTDARWVRLTCWPPQRVDQDWIQGNPVWDELLKYPPIPGGVSHIQVCFASANQECLVADMPIVSSSNSPKWDPSSLVPSHALISRLIEWCTNGMDLTPTTAEPPRADSALSPPSAAELSGDSRSVSQCISVLSSKEKLDHVPADAADPRLGAVHTVSSRSCWSSFAEPVARAHVRFHIVLAPSQQTLVSLVSSELAKALQLYRDGGGKARVDMCVQVG